MTTQVAALVLAAGAGVRLRSEQDRETPKVMRECLGRPMLHYVLDNLRGADVRRIGIVVGYGADRVRSHFGSIYDYAHQDRQVGSGDAVRCAAPLYAGFAGTMLVLCGDSPLISAGTICGLLVAHETSGATATLLTAKLPDPAGYGRVARDRDGGIVEVIEDACADEAQRRIQEVNGGAYAFDARWLFANIGSTQRNRAGEHNLTDMIRVAGSQTRPIGSMQVAAAEIRGINTESDLREVESEMLARGVVPLTRRLSHTEDGRRLLYYDFGRMEQRGEEPA